ncbi:hypothetical protein AB0F65_33380, partial [Nocardia rhamnosiphila]|uniref:hypothetical protein n=1 Tax=Nocardia rhamnosiphila TaxID=426716 RepID=UPI0033FE664C
MGPHADLHTECRRNPHASSFTRHLEGLRPVSPFRPRKRRSRRLESRGPILEIIKAGVEIPPGTLLMEDPPAHDIHRGL